jgi:hypothetical protein
LGLGRFGVLKSDVASGWRWVVACAQIGSLNQPKSQS